MKTFEHLQKRFGAWEHLTSLDDEVRLDELMTTAGGVLHAGVKAGRFHFESMPVWMMNPPSVRTPYHDRSGNELVEDATHWNTYWWHAVVWIAKNCPEAGIPLPTHSISYLHDDCWDHFSGEILPNKTQRKVSDASLYRLWGEIAAASADACAFLASVAPTSPAESRSDAEPVEYTRSVSLHHAASSWFNVDPRTLRKMIANRTIKARESSRRRWIFDLAEVTDRNPNAKRDADPLTASPASSDG